MKEPAKEGRSQVWGFLGSTQFRYIVVGIGNTIFGFLVFATLWTLLDGLLGYGVVLLIAQAIAIIQAHWAQRRFVWQSGAAFWPELARFATVYFNAYFVNLALLALCVEVLEWPVLESQMALTLLIVAITYMVNRFWTFKHSARVEPSVDQGA